MLRLSRKCQISETSQQIYSTTLFIRTNHHIPKTAENVLVEVRLVDVDECVEGELVPQVLDNQFVVQALVNKADVLELVGETWDVDAQLVLKIDRNQILDDERVE